MLAVKGWKTLQILVAILFTWLFLAICFRYSDSETWPKSLSHFSNEHRDNSKAFAHIDNETLGFEHIFAIGMKERPDKRDFLTLAALETGFEVDWLDGVRPSELRQKAMPNGYNLSSTTPTMIACWRAHLNAMFEVVQRGYSSALIFEDDADWDVNIRSQLREFARGLHALQGNDHASIQHPYGVDWDVLWIGGCGSAPFPDETQFYAVRDDPTCPNVEHRSMLGGVPDSLKSQFPEDSTRFSFKAEAGCCLYGYAVSNKGARKILAELELDHIEVAVDNALSDLCGGRSGRRQIDCYALFPQIIGTYRRPGPSSRDSDINSYDESVIHEEESWNTVYSARRNIQRLVAGEDTVYSQWNDQPWTAKEINPREFTHPKGQLVT